MSLCDPKPAKNQEFTPVYTRDNTATSEQGNAILIIFIMIALLGALYYTFSSGFRSGEKQLSKEQASLAATEILDYAQSIKQALQTLQINGCDESEISFEASATSGNYNNPNSPTDNSCHIFHPNGGGISVLSPNQNALDSEQSNASHYGYYFFSGQTTIENLGDNTKDDLLMIASWFKQDICKEINKKLFSETSIVLEPASYAHSAAFFGDYDYASSNINLSSNPKQNAAMSACFESTNYGSYHFYQVLIAR